MPLFDYYCESCDTVVEDHLAPEKPAQCERCGQPIVVPVQEPAGVIGIVFSNVQTGHDGTVLDSNRAVREHAKKNPNIRAYSKGSPDEVRLRDRIRNRAEKVAKKQGYRDHEDKVTTLKKEDAKGAFAGQSKTLKPVTQATMKPGR